MFQVIKSRLEELKDTAASYNDLPYVEAKQPLFTPGFSFGPLWCACDWTRLGLYSAETSLKRAFLLVKASQYLRLIVPTS
jgi:hypothetical protein